MTHDTRESWLRHAAQLLTTDVMAPASVTPGEYRVSCGWPARGALSTSKRRVGECWPGEVNRDRQSHVFISPCVDDPVETVGILLHELIHAALPAKAKHGKGFATRAARCGLEGKPTATVVGAGLRERINAEFLPQLGPYPHTAIDASAKPKQKTRLRLYVCQCEPDKATGRTNKVRVASDVWAAQCLTCGQDFALQSTSEEEHMSTHDRAKRMEE